MKKPTVWGQGKYDKTVEQYVRSCETPPSVREIMAALRDTNGG